MEISDSLLRQMEMDLGLNLAHVKGETIPVKNCWHFYTNGNDVDAMFHDEDDFRKGMNRIYSFSLRYKLVILAFVLMDTHVHFVLYGQYQECTAFMHEYVKYTSSHIAKTYRENNKLRDVYISHQTVDDDVYLKTVICYVIKNPTQGGLQWMPYNYPWSSGSLYFSGKRSWASPIWSAALDRCPQVKDLSFTQMRTMFNVQERLASTARIVDDIVFPGDYVAFEIVRRLFRTSKSFQYFMGQSKESDIESRGGSISNLSIPMVEMRLHKTEFCRQLFGVQTVKSLSTTQRIRLAKALKSHFNSSTKQILRLCGLKWEEAKDLL